MTLVIQRTIRYVAILALIYVGGLVVFATALYSMAFLAFPQYYEQSITSIGGVPASLVLGSMLLALGTYLIKRGRTTAKLA